MLTSTSGGSGVGESGELFLRPAPCPFQARGNMRRERADPSQARVVSRGKHRAGEPGEPPLERRRVGEARGRATRLRGVFFQTGPLGVVIFMMGDGPARPPGQTEFPESESHVLTCLTCLTCPRWPDSPIAR
eukprot:1462070-Pyramimonas_sp.AAC.1